MDGAPNNFFRNLSNCFSCIEQSSFYRIVAFHPFYPHYESSVSFSIEAPRGPVYIYMWAIELSFPFTSPFISPRAINPFLLLTLMSVTTRLIYFRSRSPTFFLSPPFDVATLDCSVNSASGEHPLSFTCTRLPLPLGWWTAFKSLHADFTRFMHYPAISADLRRS